MPNSSTPNGDDTTFQITNQAPGSLSCRFTLFPELPAELRLKIWGMALNVPRVIHLAPSKHFRKWLNGGNPNSDGNYEEDDVDAEPEGVTQVDTVEQAPRYPRGPAEVAASLAIEGVTDEGEDGEDNEDEEDNDGNTGEEIDDDKVPSAGTVACKTGPPSLLHVCQESRFEASMAYLQCCDRVLLKVVEYQANVDVLLLDNPNIFRAFLKGRLRILGYKSPTKHVSITSVAIRNVDFRSLHPDLARAKHLTPHSIGWHIGIYADLERVTFITDASRIDTPSRQLLIQPLTRAFPYKFADRAAEDHQIAIRIYREDVESMTYGADPYDYDGFLSNVRAAAQASRVTKALTPRYLPVVLEYCTLEQFQVRYK